MHLIRSRVVRMAILAALPLAAASCNEAAAPNLGRVIVSVAETNNTPAALIPVDLLLGTTRQVWRAVRTTSNGTAEFGAEDGGVVSQDYIVRVDLVGSKYVFADGETAEKPVSVVAGQIYTIAFKVKKEIPEP